VTPAVSFISGKGPTPRQSRTSATPSTGTRLPERRSSSFCSCAPTQRHANDTVSPPGRQRECRPETASRSSSLKPTDRARPPLLVCLPARGDPSIRTRSSVEVRPPHFEIGRGGHTVANSNLGNGNLRPETFGRTRQELPLRIAGPLLRPVLGEVSHGNVVLSCGEGNHVGLRGLPGGGRSPAKPVSGGSFPANREKNRDSCPKIGFRLLFCLGFGIQNNGLQENSLRNKTGN
jgi:hypothetical protein